MTRRTRRARTRRPRWVHGLSPNCRDGLHGPEWCSGCPCTHPACHDAPPPDTGALRDHRQITALADQVRAELHRTRVTTP